MRPKEQEPSLMPLSRNREKLINVIVFFASNTEHCGKVKLFKLLYLFDFVHFRQTGRSVTGLDYRAWKMGPVPLELMQEWEDLEADLAKAIDIVPEPVIDFIRERVVPKVKFVIPVGSLDKRVLLESLECVANADDTTRIQERAIRDEIAKLR